MRESHGRAGRGGQPGLRLRAALILLPVALLSFLTDSPAQAPGEARVFYSRHREFRIPFNLDPGENRISSVRLHVSETFGQTWQNVASAQPGAERFFPFRTERDGWYWFTVQTVDANGRGFPAVVDSQTLPMLKVCVDTRDPVVTLQAAQAPEGMVGVTWTAQDENLKNLRPDMMVLDYRASGRGGNWTRIPIEPRVQGQRQWAPEWAGALEVRLRATDDAGNEGQHTITLQGTRQARAVPPEGGNFDSPAGAGPAAGVSPERKLVNTKQVQLRYDVQDVGKSGVSEVQLWFTDGRTWILRGQKKMPQPPYLYEVQLENEGVYGFTLRARSGVGEAEREPQIGDPPQIWIEADWTPPRVTLYPPQVGRGTEAGVLMVSYSADDKNGNLDGKSSIQISYSEKPEGPWTPCGPKQDNTGRFRWEMQPMVPYQFYLQVEATDRAGNVGKATTPERITVDLSRPRTKVVTVEPVPPSNP